MDLIQKIKEQGNQAGVLLNDILQTRVVFIVPREDSNNFLGPFISNGANFSWDFNSFEDIKALFENFNILQSIIVARSSSLNIHSNYTLQATYTRKLGTHTEIEKVFTSFDLDGVGSGDDYEPAITKRGVLITVFVDNNGKIDIEKTLNDGTVIGSTSVVKGTAN